MRLAPRLAAPFRALAAACALAAVAAHAGPPATPQRPVTDTYHGVAVTDPYRWMEQADSAEYRGWIQAQAAHASQALDALPGRAALAARVQALAQAGPTVSGLAWGGSRLFYLATEPGRGAARLMVRDDAHSARACCWTRPACPSRASAWRWATSRPRATAATWR